MKYNPTMAPNSEKWLAMDEDEQIELAREYHEHARIEVPNLIAHAAMHATVETQAAMGDETPVAAAIERLRGEGLDRHEAVHAVASVLIEHMARLVRGDGLPSGDPNAPYYEAVRELTAQQWYDLAEE